MSHGTGPADGTTSQDAADGGTAGSAADSSTGSGAAQVRTGGSAADGSTGSGAAQVRTGGSVADGSTGRSAADGRGADVEEPVSAALRDAKARARSTHYTVGCVRTDPDGTLWLECSCGTVLRNGPTWTLDEHVRLHRAEAKYLELSAAAPPGIPRLIPL